MWCLYPAELTKKQIKNKDSCTIKTVLRKTHLFDGSDQAAGLLGFSPWCSGDVVLGFCLFDGISFKIDTQSCSAAFSIESCCVNSARHHEDTQQVITNRIVINKRNTLVGVYVKRCTTGCTILVYFGVLGTPKVHLFTNFCKKVYHSGLEPITFFCTAWVDFCLL